jgi:hypothetical protein
MIDFGYRLSNTMLKGQVLPPMLWFLHQARLELLGFACAAPLFGLVLGFVRDLNVSIRCLAVLALVLFIQCVLIYQTVFLDSVLKIIKDLSG